MQPTDQAKALLNEHYKWPVVFEFKFVVPAEKSAELKALLPAAVKVESRPSSAGRYLGLTFHLPMGSADEVLAVYSKVKTIDGLLAL